MPDWDEAEGRIKKRNSILKNNWRRAEKPVAFLIFFPVSFFFPRIFFWNKNGGCQTHPPISHLF